LLLEERFSACALGSLICSQLALLLDIGTEGECTSTRRRIFCSDQPGFAIPLYLPFGLGYLDGPAQ
jgi:hypothetical protein